MLTSILCMVSRDLEKRREYARNRYYENREYILGMQRIDHKVLYNKYRESLFQFLGSSCVICGFSDKRALEFDHINGGGSAQRKILKNNTGIHRYYAKRAELAKKELQVLCANCNRIKRSENNECKRKRVVGFYPKFSLT